MSYALKIHAHDSNMLIAEPLMSFGYAMHNLLSCARIIYIDLYILIYVDLHIFIYVDFIFIHLCIVSRAEDHLT